jgi:hypothetical protein
MMNKFEKIIMNNYYYLTINSFVKLEIPSFSDSSFLYLFDKKEKQSNLI